LEKVIFLNNISIIIKKVGGKISLAQKKKYDINHKILETVANLESRAIIFSLVKKSKTAEEISKEEKIPQSSVYSKLSDLLDLGLVYVDSMERTYAGKTTKFYKSRIKEIAINLKSIEPKLVINLTSK